jgi:hypothetical protein
MLNPAQGEMFKDAGQALAMQAAGHWRMRAIDEFSRWLKTQKALGFQEITVEMFRAQANNHPASHKAWGALPRYLCEAGLIEPLLDAQRNPKYRRAAAPKTHAHPVRLWRIR